MPVLTVTITHPTGAPSASFVTTNLTIPHESDSWARATFTIYPPPEQWALLSSETNDDNQLQTNAYVDIVRGTQHIFRGSIETIHRQSAEPRGISITALDKAGRTNGAMATISGSLTGSLTSPVVRCHDYDQFGAPSDYITLYRISTGDGFATGNEWRYYPAYIYQHTASHDSTRAWIAQDSCRSTTLSSDIVNASTIFTVTDASQFTCPCFISIGSELIFCDNLYQDSAGVWTFHIGERAVCGSAQNDHDYIPAVTIYQRIPKPICSEKDISVTRDPSATAVANTDYRVRYTEARFDFAVDSTSWTTIKADYYYYDVDDPTNGISLASLFSSMLTATVANNGPGYAAGELDVTGLATTFVPTFKLDTMRHVMDCIRDLQAEYWAQGITNNDRLMCYYSATDDKLVFKSATQATTPHTVMSSASETVITTSMTNLYNAALVAYTSAEPVSLLSSARCWHPARGEDPATLPNAGALTDNWDAILYQDIERADAVGWQSDTSTTSHNVYTQRLFDGDINSGWGIHCANSYWQTADPGIWTIFTWPTAAVNLTYARMTVDIRNYVMGYYQIALVGLDAYTPGDPPTLGNEVDLGISYTIHDAVSPSGPRPTPNGKGGWALPRWVE